MRTAARLGVVAILALLVGAVALVACKRALPAPWSEAKFPLSQAEIMPGADEKGFQASYPDGTPPADLFREYQRALEAKSWSVLKQGSSHDPDSQAYSVIMRRGAERLLLTVTGGKPVQAKVTTSVD